jgi:hypothetical protein
MARAQLAARLSLAAAVLFMVASVLELQRGLSPSSVFYFLGSLTGLTAALLTAPPPPAGPPAVADADADADADAADATPARDSIAPGDEGRPTRRAAARRKRE